MATSGRVQQLMFIVFMALGMSCAMSFAMTLVMLGLDHWTVMKWLKAWLIALCVAVPVAMVWAPIARRLAGAIVK